MQRQAYENDQKNYFAQRNLSHTRKIKEDEEVEKKLKDFEKKMEEHTEIKIKALNDTKHRAEEHCNAVMQKLMRIRNTSPDDEDYTSIAKSFQQKIENVKKRDRMLKNK